MAEQAVFALLDDASPEGRVRARTRLYTDHAGTLDCHDVAAWPQVLERLQDALAAGLYAVPVLSYELGAHLLGIGDTPCNPADAPSTPPPLAQVLLFARYEVMDAAQVDAWLHARARAADDDGSNEPAGIAALSTDIDEAAFAHALARIHDYIAAGDTYQVNYTYRLHFDAFGSIHALYARLRARQPVPYGALIALPDGRAVLSLSPELFVRLDASRLLARPMKGTAPAAHDEATDAVRARALAADPKNRAENLMIVDLLRNDLGRIARTGSVAAPTLFDVRRYGAVLQMTSTVRADLRADAGLAEVFEALYPCGSITGAPKRRTMEIIGELEPSPRGIYTGAIGWIDPPDPRTSSPGRRFGDFCLSVPIRTLTLQAPLGGVRRGSMGVGAGIVHDSEAGAEWAECRLKARFLTGLVNDVDIFETMHATRADGCRHLERHLARLEASCAYFGHVSTIDLARGAVLNACAHLADGEHRLRLTVRPDGEIVVQTGPLTPLAGPVTLLLADEATRADDLFLRHKTSVRTRYDDAWRAAERQGAFDALFFNERGELTEGGRSNVFVRIEGRWMTSPLSAGVLPGVMRAVLLADPAWDAIERPISRAMLQHAHDIVVCNALRGALHATLSVSPNPSSHPAARP